MADLPNAGTSSYPTSIDTATTIVASDALIPSRDNGPNVAIINMQTEMGTGLKGSVADLATRLNVALAASGALITTVTSWTPTDQSGAGLTLTIGNGTVYVKIGNLVICNFDITYPVTASGANALIGGLPSTSRNTTADEGTVSVGSNSATTNFVSGLVVSNATNFYLFSQGNTRLTNANLSTAYIRGIVFYFSST